MPVTWSILSPTGSPGAIGIVGLRADTTAELDAALERIGVGSLSVGQARLRSFFGLDTGIAARWTATCCHLMPHGGVGIIRAMTGRLEDAEIHSRAEHDLRAAFPEATSIVEARMLETLSHAASPLAVDLLLSQPRRWEVSAESDPELDRVLSRLVEPPLVVALGPPNVGKSTLVNTLAGRTVALVADEPGTTRDHVGVHLNLAGLVVRYLDTPGIRETDGSIEREAQEIALRASRAADLILLMGDASAPAMESLAVEAPTVRIALRADLGPASWPHELAASAATGQGIAALVDFIRGWLVPDAALGDSRPWRFWKEHAATGRS